MSKFKSINPHVAVVLLSGGLDSATTAAIARDEGFALFALSIDYGQRHRFELDAARRVAESLGVVRHVVVSVGLDQFGGSALTDDIAVPLDRDEQEIAAGIPVTYVPARNTVFLSLALGYAEVVGAADLFIGVNAIDYSGYPDCRPEFIAAFERLANLATKAGVEGSDAVSHPHAADPNDQGRNHPPRHGAGRRLRPDALVLCTKHQRHRLRPLRRLPTATERLCRSGTHRSDCLSFNLERRFTTEAQRTREVEEMFFSKSVFLCSSLYSLCLCG